MIEDKIFIIKSRMIDFTIKQQDIQQQIENLNSDIQILQAKIDETQTEQSNAIELEDYDKADNLDMRIKQTRKLVEAKEHQIKQMQENNQTQEVMKADKLQELTELMHKSAGRVESIKEKQKIEMKMYEESEQKRIEDGKARLETEAIRIEQDKNNLEDEKNQIESKLAKIDDLVYEDTKDQHLQKYRLDENIDDLAREIEELTRVLDRKKKQKEMLSLEKAVHDKQIQYARNKYGDQLGQFEFQKEQVNNRIAVNVRD